jgi:restriction endonuclease S subunit
VPENIKPVRASRSTLVITPDKSKINPAYLFAIFRNDLIKTQLNRLSIGSTMRNVTPRLVGEILIPLIPMESQNRIAGNIDQYYQYQFAARRTLDQIDTEVNSLLGVNEEGSY